MMVFGLCNVRLNTKKREIHKDIVWCCVNSLDRQSKNGSRLVKKH